MYECTNTRNFWKANIFLAKFCLKIRKKPSYENINELNAGIFKSSHRVRFVNLSAIDNIASNIHALFVTINKPKLIVNFSAKVY